jgi:glycosyltransferase involved in cell wall biosynthesis
MIRVCHFSSVHKAYDTRILLKECTTLASNGYEVHLVAQAEKSEVLNGVKIHALPAPRGGRLARVCFFTWKTFWRARKTGAHIYHFHDPELIPFGFLLKLMGKTVIFDVHENIARQIKVKHYLPLRHLVSKAYGIIDWLSARSFHLILAEESYRTIYQKFTSDFEVIMNMPDTQFLRPFRTLERPTNEEIQLFYVGGVTFERGIETVVKALLELRDSGILVRFHCVGPFEPSTMERILKIDRFAEVESQIHFYGPERLDLALERSRVCHIGISILMPIENYLESYSTKIFEYMAIGLPVITSNFPLYKNVVEKHKCGLCVNPIDPSELAKAIQEICESNEVNRAMAANGVQAAEKYYNWSHEADKMLSYYRGVLGKSHDYGG